MPEIAKLRFPYPFLTLLFTLLIVQSLHAQQPLPVLHASSSELSVRDGGTFMQDYWSASADIPLDVYMADRSSTVKTVTFYSDQDSLSVQLNRGQSYDFYVVIDGMDSCLTRIQSDVFVGDVSELTSDTIPFVLSEHNNIVIEATLNGIDTLRLMFHTDAGAVALTEAAVSKMQALHFGDSVKAKSWGGENASSYSQNNTLDIHGLTWRGITIWKDRNSGHGTDGKFGPHLFEDKVIELNYDQRILIVHSKLPYLSNNFTQHPIQFSRGSMFIEGTVQLGDESIPQRFLMHSGFSGAMLLDDEFAAKHGLSNRLEILGQSELKDAFGQTIITKRAIMPQFSVGEYTFQNVPMAFFQGTVGNERMSVIGCDVLRHFNIVFDLQEAYVYLTPSQDFGLAFESK